VLRYVENEEIKILKLSCPDCKGEVEIRETAGNCPKCGKPLREEQSGLWD
jgi:Zn finger protein HypA/HybF involved in hydrogenase expression